MVFQRHDDTALFGSGDALFDAFDAPFETVLLGAAGQDRLDTAGFHQVVEVSDGVPAPGVEPDTRDAELIGDFEAFVGMLDLLGALGRVLLDEILVD